MNDEENCCHDCGVKEGELHTSEGGICDMEKCPICLKQLLSCDHELKKDSIRIPYIQIPFFCSLCGTKYPELFMDKKWDFFVPPPLDKKVLCKNCYEWVKDLFPNGWRGVEK